nr:MAG TPA: hypothetical protein [Caudoviricetes sp.]
MKDLMIFENEEFGKIRTVTIEDDPMFCLTDICRALELTQPSKVKERLNEKGVNSIPTLTKGGKQNLLYINESNLYKVIFQSRKESAEKFTDWVTSEVLPSIRKTGSYDMKNYSPEMQAILMHDEKIVKIDGRVTDLENNMVIDYGQQQTLKNEVNKVVVNALGGKKSNAYKEVSKKVFSEINHDIQEKFTVNSRNNVPKKRFNEAIAFVRSWSPSQGTKWMIDGCNAQMSL